jgi:hypothetical protein
MSEGNTKHCRASHRLGRMILKWTLIKLWDVDSNQLTRNWFQRWVLCTQKVAGVVKPADSLSNSNNVNWHMNLIFVSDFVS